MKGKIITKTITKRVKRCEGLTPFNVQGFEIVSLRLQTANILISLRSTWISSPLNLLYQVVFSVPKSQTCRVHQNPIRSETTPQGLHTEPHLVLWRNMCQDKWLLVRGKKESVRSQYLLNWHAESIFDNTAQSFNWISSCLIIAFVISGDKTETRKKVKRKVQGNNQQIRKGYRKMDKDMKEQIYEIWK